MSWAWAWACALRKEVAVVRVVATGPALGSEAMRRRMGALGGRPDMRPSAVVENESWG
jgi:hypothetical protein